MKTLFLYIILSFSLLFGRENPFAPMVVNKNSVLIKKTFFKEKKFQLPSDARVLKSVIFEYQSLNGSIKKVTFPIEKEVDWHNPLLLQSLKKVMPKKYIKVGFLKFFIDNKSVTIFTNEKILRNFLLVAPFRYVIDFQAEKNFLSYSKTIKDSFVKAIKIGNHSSFYRVVLFLDGEYKSKIKKIQKGYKIEFK
jgi:hypothetical protein